MATRSEHRRATLLSLSNAAIDLFESVGPAVTIDAIAERAGVSRRTVFRYVDQKEDLAFIHPVLWFDVFDASIDRMHDQPIGERLRLSSRAIAHHIDNDPRPPRRAFEVVGRHRELARGFTAVYQQWIERIAAEVLAGLVPSSAERFRARIIGAAVMGMVDAVTREWIISSGSASFTELYDRGFAMLEPLLVTPGSEPV